MHHIISKRRIFVELRYIKKTKMVIEFFS